MTARDIYSTSIRSLMHFWFRLTRSMTIGVRAMVIDDQGRVLLIRPRYSSGLIFPGGGLERGETAIGALVRELKEEAAVTLTGEPNIFGFYSHEKEFRGDHVVLYVVRDFELGVFVPTVEIREARFCDPQHLPAEVTKGTQRRIQELIKGEAPTAYW
jgi:8-oxo-dGTP pyrophosphatase MutT (NUDIX family)